MQVLPLLILVSQESMDGKDLSGAHTATLSTQRALSLTLAFDFGKGRTPRGGEGVFLGFLRDHRFTGPHTYIKTPPQDRKQ